MARHSKRTAAEVWQQRFARFESSGLTVKAFCASEEVSEPSFYHWRKKLREAKEHTSQATKPVFQPIRITSTVAMLSIELPNGTRLEVPADHIELACAVVREVASASGSDHPRGA